jgi:hypothetical protein
MAARRALGVELRTFLNHGAFGALPRELMAAAKMAYAARDAAIRFIMHELPFLLRQAAAALARLSARRPTGSPSSRTRRAASPA